MFRILFIICMFVFTISSAGYTAQQVITNGDTMGAVRSDLDTLYLFVIDKDNSPSTGKLLVGGSTPSTSSPLGGNSHFNNIGTGHSSINFN